MMTRPLVSLVTVFWNGADDVARFLDAIAVARTRLPFGIEVVAVDNASTDGTADALAARDPSVVLIRNARNVGFAPACNQALEAARGRFLLLLNPDCEADADAIAGMVRYLARHRRVGAVGCALLHGDGLPQNSWHHDPSWWSYWGSHSLLSPALLRVTKRLHRALGRNGHPRRVDWLMGACLMVPRAVYERIGGLDAAYFMYSEDADWCRRIRDAGFAVVHLPRWSMVHHHGTSARRRPEFAFRRLYRSMLMYANKHLGVAGARALRAAILADMALRRPIYTLTGNAARLESVRLVMRAYRSNRPTLIVEPDAEPC
ncbi:MAG: glycosyltransferase family 2 protein [Candidatus Sumerlaeia bacterium]|nr:glycosyltransferase family 2 protein [Candidatus Sumerlaeia bacterium]